MLFTIDTSSPVPLAEQVAGAVRRAMADGSLRMGDRLPAARALARDLQVNMHTVLRGYQILKDESLIDLRPGRGAVVTATAPRSHAALIEAGRRLITLSRELGLSDAEILRLVEEQLS
ncbi:MULTISPECIES: GntR family transcriptional regulator [unclassified Streptomyces]|uniref:GntR family transcriptional regulator n=1 Tax=unclassified Streptomyces TaxID=2593676 RepID=UPI003824D8E6